MKVLIEQQYRVAARDFGGHMTMLRQAYELTKEDVKLILLCYCLPSRAVTRQDIADYLGMDRKELQKKLKRIRGVIKS